MGELISGKEALIALANDKDVECCVTKRDSGLSEYWFSAKTLTIYEIEGEKTEGNPDGTGIYRIRFRLKPRTVNLNGVEVPSVKYVAHSGGNCVKISCECPEDAAAIGAALRSIFNPK